MDQKHENGMKISTVQKYTEVLKQLVEDVANPLENVKAKDFTRKHHVHTDFVTLAARLGYIRAEGKGPRTTYVSTGKRLTDIHPMDGKKLAFEMAKIQRERRGLNEKLAEPETKLLDFTDEELFSELARRGWAGELNKTKVLTR